MCYISYKHRRGVSIFFVSNGATLLFRFEDGLGELGVFVSYNMESVSALGGSKNGRKQWARCEQTRDAQVAWHYHTSIPQSI